MLRLGRSGNGCRPGVVALAPYAPGSDGGSYFLVRRHVAGLEYILVGALLFAAATSISVIKASRLRRRVTQGWCASFE